MPWHKLRAPLSLLPCLALLACGDDKGSTETDAGTSTTASTETTGTTASTGTTEPEPTGTGSTSTATGSTSGSTGSTATTSVDPTTGDTTTGEPVCPYDPVDGNPGFALEIVASGFDRPLMVRPDPENPDRLFVLEQGGRIKILEPGQTMAPADSFIDLDVKNKNPGQVGPEQGMLGFDFHPDFPADPRVYINYNPGAWQGAAPTYVSEFKLDPNDPNKLDPASERLVIAIDQPAGNHNGGMVEFGPDGYLYIGMGDGGGADDQFNTGRDPQSLHAKILRIDVEPDGQPDSNDPCGQCDMLDGFDYTVPADNPFVGDNNFAPEVWAWGFRNPWRFAFDPPTGTLYAGDVGQNQWEEISVVEKGKDYGWSLMEGNHCFNGGCDESAGPNEENDQGLVAPIAEYNHGEGCSVTGGRVYHSCQVPGWDGTYFYGDYCSGGVYALHWDGSSVESFGEVATQQDRILGTGHNGHGDVFFTVVELDDFNSPVDGKLLRVVPQ